MNYTIAGGGLTVWFLLNLILKYVLHVPASQMMWIRLLLGMVIGVITGLVLYLRKKKRLKFGKLLPGDAANDIETMVRESEGKMAASKLGPDAKFRSLPVVFIAGPASSMKTTSVVQSGLQPELLGGQVYQDGVIAPTALANFWYAQDAIFVEVGDKLMADSAMWSTLLKEMQPGKLRSALSRGQLAPRAVVVCQECESFLKPGAVDAATASAKSIRSKLSELSATVGINVPVYVLFTKLDRVAFFSEYVKTLDNQEAKQILGVTLPIWERRAGVYGELESEVLSQSFIHLVNSLCGKRPEFLGREPDAAALPAVYEFPREFRKLRSPLVQFLLELCRPSQLETGPFLRGYYFTGVRPVVIQEELAAQAASPAGGRSEALDPGATRMFRAGESMQPAAAAAPVSRIITKKVPQWCFLPRFYGDVVLSDRTALGASAPSVKANLLRRILLSSAAALLLIFAGLALLSYSQNKKLVDDVRTAASSVAADKSAGELASLDSLTKLDDLRAQLQQLSTYDSDGPPATMRLGLYAGDSLLPDVRRLYFQRFNTLLLHGTQQNLLKTMRSWPPSPTPSDNYGDAYNTLKGYLVTTSNHEKSTLEFLPPLLLERWAAGQSPDNARLKLARRQFDFYAAELKEENPYSSATDAPTVERARKYLAQFGGAPRIYQAMLSDANAANKPVNFNQKFPGSAQVLVNSHDVSGAFTKGGYAFMQKAIKNPEKYVSGEQWVLGSQTSSGFDMTKLADDVRALYYADFINQWRDYLKRSVVVRYTSLGDAATKLAATSGPQSPLMELFALATQNTAVDAAPVLKAFKPLHTLMPPANVDGPFSSNYMNSLLTLQSAVEGAAKMPPEQSEAAAAQVSTAATAARLAARQTALTLGLDPDAHIEGTIQKLLEDPITDAEAIAPSGPSPIPLNTGGAGLCSQVRSLLSKYPFDPSAKPRATLDDVNGIFQPEKGALWAFYDAKLKKMLPKNGSAYQPDPAAKPTLTSHFVAFFNNAARFSNALYNNGASKDPKLSFSLKPAFSSEVQNVSLTINGQAATFHSNGAAQQFSWPGSGGVRLTVKNGSDFIYPSYDGLWAIFEFFGDADKPIPSPEWMLKSGLHGKLVTNDANQPIVVHFDLDMLGNPPVFQKDYFRSLACVAEVAK
jgi:type VI secretion system protein ImpL